MPSSQTSAIEVSSSIQADTTALSESEIEELDRIEALYTTGPPTSSPVNGISTPQPAIPDLQKGERYVSFICYTLIVKLRSRCDSYSNQDMLVHTRLAHARSDSRNAPFNSESYVTALYDYQPARSNSRDTTFISEALYTCPKHNTQCRPLPSALDLDTPPRQSTPSPRSLSPIDPQMPGLELFPPIEPQIPALLQEQDNNYYAVKATGQFIFDNM